MMWNIKIRDGKNAFAYTQATFTVPSVSGSVAVTTNDTSWMAVGQSLFISDGTNQLQGHVSAVGGTHAFTFVLDAVVAGAGAGATMATTAKVSPSGTVNAATTPVGTALTSGRVWVGNGSNAAAEVAVSGDATLSNAGALTIANDAVTTAKIDDNAVSSAKVDSTVIIAAGSNAFTGDQSMGTHKITNLGSPSSSTDAATKGYVDSAVTGLLDFKGATDCSANPDYPAASKGDAYIVSVAGKIGGASGTSVDVGDWYVATADNAGGTEGSVGSSWGHMEHNTISFSIGTAVGSGTNYNILSIDGSGDVSQISPSTSGYVLTSNGTGAAATFQELPASASGANPSASVGLSAVNGAASTFMRSDGAPALSQAIVPIWTGVHTWTPTTANTNSPFAVNTIAGYSSGTVANGFGVVRNLLLHTTAGGFGAQASDITTTWVDATNATRKARVVHSVYDTAARESFREEASGSAAMIGFLGASASAQLSSPDAGTALVTFGLASGTPTFAWANLTGAPALPISKANGGTAEDNSTGGTANTFWARPNGATGAATYRAIVAADIPTLNQNTTGSAATLTTARAIYGNNFDGSAALTQIIASTYGGTGNGFTKFSGPTTAEKTFTLPDASATILTSNAAVTVAQGGTGDTSLTAYAVLCGGTTSTGAVQSVASVGTAGQVLTSNGAGALPTFQAAGGSPTTTKGDLAGYSSASARVPVGSDGQLLMADSSQSLGLGWSFPVVIGSALPGASILNITSNNQSGTGNQDLYTVPAGKRLLIASITALAPSGASTVYGLAKVSGTYYRLGANASIGTGSPTAINFSSYIFEAGEIVAINQTVAGVNYWGRGILFDNTSGLKTAKVLALSNGDNTIYTCPANKTAIGMIAGGGYTQSMLYYVNDSGATRTYSVNVVTSGGSVASTNKLVNAQTNSDKTVLTIAQFGAVALSAGDFVNLNTDAGTANQTAWVTVFEF